MAGGKQGQRLSAAEVAEMQAFDAAGFHTGDVVAVRALGPGRVELTRLDELFAKHRGRVKAGAGAREAVERLRDEWL